MIRNHKFFRLSIEKILIFGILVLSAFVVGFIIIKEAEASDKTFTAVLERFEISGNAPGTFVDDFDDGNVSPGISYRGTVTESGGATTIGSPGEHNTLFHNLINVDGSVLIPQSASIVEDGAGDFDATSTWAELVTPGSSGFQYMLLRYKTSDTTDERVLVAVLNYPAILGLLLGVGSDLVIAQAVLTFDLSGSYPVITSTDAETTSIDPGDITGDIQLGLSFDDTANTFTTTYSIDNGATIETPFSTMSSSISSTSTWVLGSGEVFLF